MTKKEQIKKFVKEHKKEIIEVSVFTAVNTLAGLACIEIGERIALGGVGRGLTKIYNEALEEGQTPSNWKFIGNMFKGYKMINTET